MWPCLSRLWRLLSRVELAFSATVDLATLRRDLSLTTVAGRNDFLVRVSSRFSFLSARWQTQLSRDVSSWLWHETCRVLWRMEGRGRLDEGGTVWLCWQTL